MMRKQSAFEAWKILLLSLPKGIAGFVVAVAGIAVSLPLSVLLIGLPLLAAVLLLCRRMLDTERGLVDAWLRGDRAQAADEAAAAGDGGPSGWKGLLSVIGNGRAYRGLFHAVALLPVGILSFTLAIVLPVTAGAIMLSPLAQYVSMRWFSFDLFANTWLAEQTFLPFALSSDQQSWIAGGIGLLFVLLMPMTLRMLGRFYAAWIQGVAGPAPAPQQPALVYDERESLLSDPERHLTGA